MKSHLLTLTTVIAALTLPVTAKVTDDPDLLPKEKKTSPAPKPATTQPQKVQKQVHSSVEDAITKYFISTPIKKGINSMRHIDTTINGKPFALRLDSGADSIILAKSLADELKIPLKEVGVASGAGTSAGKVYEGKIDSFKVGKHFDLGSPSIHFLDLANVKNIRLQDGSTIPNSGQLGLGFLNATPAAIDYPNNRLLVQKQTVQGGIASIYKQLGDSSAPMVEGENRRHYVGATVKGKQVYFLVDTGAGPCVIYDTAAKSLGLTIQNKKATVSSVGGKNRPAKISTLEALRIGEVKVGGKIEVLVIPHQDALPNIKGKPLVGIIGATLFEALKATIDFQSDTITMAVTRKQQ